MRYIFIFFIYSNLLPIESYEAGNFCIIRCGKLVTISFSNKHFNITANAFTKILDITDAPLFEYGASFTWASGGNVPKAGMLKVTTDKKLLMWADASSITYAYGSITYMIK